LVGPTSFNCKLLNNSSIPRDMNANVAFCKKVAKLRKATSAAGDLLGNMDSRLKNMEKASHDMLASPQSIISKISKLNKEYRAISLKLNGDATRAKREFESLPSVDGKVGIIEGSIWNTTSPITKTNLRVYDQVSKEFSSVLSDMKKLNKSIDDLEKELEMNQAPYTQGRWPEWK